MRGSARAQPGGWLYNILPYMDQVDLHDTGKGGTNKTVGGTRTLIVVREFLCRTRHGRDQAFPFSGAYINVTNPTGAVGRCDYAANAGSNFVDPGAFGSPGANGMGGIYNPNFAWGNYPGTMPPNSVAPSTGVIFRASTVSSAMIKDGPSYTYLLGERYMTVNYYNQSPEGEVTGVNPPASENDTGWDSGYDYNTIRWTGVSEIVTTSSGASPLVPAQDQSLRNMPGVTPQTIALFGSAHNAGFYMAFADGRVQLINYNIDPSTHMQSGQPQRRRADRLVKDRELVTAPMPPPPRANAFCPV